MDLGPEFGIPQHEETDLGEEAQVEEGISESEVRQQKGLQDHRKRQSHDSLHRTMGGHNTATTSGS